MDNKQFVLDYVDAFNRGDLGAVCECFHTDAMVWGVLGWGSVEQVRPIWKDLIECLEIHLEVEDIISEGDVVAVRYRESGRSIAPFRGHPATGRSYEVTAMEWFEIRHGRIEKRWGARDSDTLFRQLGFRK